MNNNHFDHNLERLLSNREPGLEQDPSFRQNLEASLYRELSTPAQDRQKKPVPFLLAALAAAAVVLFLLGYTLTSWRGQQERVPDSPKTETAHWQPADHAIHIIRTD